MNHLKRLIQTLLSTQGHWMNGVADKDGIELMDNSKNFQEIKKWATYDGDWKDDKMNERGRLIHADGNIYEGEWKDN